jgi:iron complex transport system substrate-binding protein
MDSTPVDPSFIVEARGHRFPARSADRRVRGTHTRLALALATVALLAAACTTGRGSPSTPATDAPTGPAGTSPSAVTSATPTAAAFPIDVVDDEGTAVTIQSEPQRIVSLTAAATEILFAIEAGDRVVATDSASDFPAEAQALPDVGAFGTVNVEQIVGLEADLVIAGGNGDTPPDGVARMRALGLPVVVIYAPTIDAVLADVRLLGQASGESVAAETLADSMRAELDALAAAVQADAKPRVFYEVDATREIYGPADQSFLAEMLVRAGSEPITSGSPNSFQISLERLVAEDPEVIVLGDAAFGTTPEVVAARAGWGGMTAVKEGDIRPVDDKLITRPGPRLGQGLRALILAIHPDALLP